MLVITRKATDHNNAIFIGENAEIKVYVLEVNGKQVKLGIDAPRELSVHREEIWNKIQGDNVVG